MNEEKERKIQQLEEQLSHLKHTSPHLFKQSHSLVSPEDRTLEIQDPSQTLPQIPPSKTQTVNNSNNQENFIKDPEERFFSPQAKPSRTEFKDPNKPPLPTNRTAANFFIKQEKEKSEAAAERLIHSVNAVTELLKANTELRDHLEKSYRASEEKDSEIFQMQVENQSLRERLELVEGILKNSRHDYDTLVSDNVRDHMQRSNTQYGGFGSGAGQGGGQSHRGDSAQTTIDGVYTELI